MERAVVIVRKKNGKTYLATIRFELLSQNVDIQAAVKAAAAEFAAISRCETAHEPFDPHILARIPNFICEKHGFRLVQIESTAAFEQNSFLTMTQ